MKWLIKQMGGYTEAEFKRAVNNADLTNKITQVRAETHAKLFRDDTISKAILALKEAIDDREYNKINEGLFLIASEVMPLTETDSKSSDAENTFQLLDLITRFKNHLQTSMEERLKQSIEAHKEEMANCVNDLQGDTDHKTLGVPIEDLRLMSRAHNALDRAGYTIVGEVAILSIDEVGKIKNIGTKSADEVAEAMRKRGFPLRGKLPANIDALVRKYVAAKACMSGAEDELRRHQFKHRT